MYVVVEMWTPKQSFLHLPSEKKAELFDGIKSAMQGMAGVGIVTLGWGAVDSHAPFSTGHEWFAVWQAPTKELSAAFLAGVQSAGWYDYFEQVNVVGELRSVDDVAAEHLELVGVGQ